MNIYYQGVDGAYSSLAADAVAQGLTAPVQHIVGCQSFAEAWQAVGDTHVAVLPIENSYAGTIHANIYGFLSHEMQIIGEYTLTVNHYLLACPGASMESIKEVYSHPQALAQTYQYCKEQNLIQKKHADTAGAAQMVSKCGDQSIAAIASSKAGELYGLQTLDQGIQDQEGNQTRFLVLRYNSNEIVYQPVAGKFAVLFRCRDVPGVLYKCLGAFATHGIDLTKIESLPAQQGPFEHMFWVEARGGENSSAVQGALEELAFFTQEVRVLGWY